MNNVQHFRHCPQPRSIPLDHLFLSSSACGICCCASSSLLLLSSSSSYNDRLLLQNVLDALQLTIIMALTMFLCGASSYANIEHTFLAALFLSSLIAMDLPFDNLQQQQQQQQSRQPMQTMETITTMALVLDILWRILPSSLTLMRMTDSHDGWLCQIQHVSNHKSMSNFTLVRLRMASPMMASTYNIGICHLGGPWEFLVSLNPASNCQTHCTTITLHEIDSRQRLAKKTSKRKQNLNALCTVQEVSIHI